MSDVQKEAPAGQDPVQAPAEAAPAGAAGEALTAAPPAQEPAPGPDQPEAGEVEALRAEVAALRAELDRTRAEMFEKLARAQADFENYRRRAQREREETIAYANLNLVRELLPVLDNLERALAATGEEGGIKAGVELVARQFRDVLAKHGVTPVEALGQPFDPEVHEAVMQEAGDYDVPTVVAELQKGYRMGNRLVRPALVKVARRDA